MHSLLKLSYSLGTLSILEFFFYKISLSQSLLLLHSEVSIFALLQKKVSEVFYSAFDSAFLHSQPFCFMYAATSVLTLVSYSVPDHRFDTKFTAEAPLFSWGNSSPSFAGRPKNWRNFGQPSLRVNVIQMSFQIKQNENAVLSILIKCKFSVRVT